MNASEQADLVLGYTRSWAMFVSWRPAPEDFSLPPGPCWVWPWHALAASGVALENGGDETGAEGEERGGVNTCTMEQRVVGLVTPTTSLACVFSQWGRKQEAEHRKWVKCNGKNGIKRDVVSQQNAPERPLGWGWDLHSSPDPILKEAWPGAHTSPTSSSCMNLSRAEWERGRSLDGQLMIVEL